MTTNTLKSEDTDRNFRIKNITIRDGQVQDSTLHSFRRIIEFNYSSKNNFIRKTLTNHQIPDKSSSSFCRKLGFLLKGTRHHKQTESESYFSREPSLIVASL